MAKKNFRKKVIFIAEEATYGVDAGPAGAPANAIQTKNLSITPLEGDELQRQLDTGALGALPTLLAGVHALVEFDVDMAGSGAAGTAPAYGTLFLGCGFAETVNSGVSVDYDPVSSGFSSLSIYTYIDNNLHVLLGARGSVGVKGDMKSFADWHFKFMGLFVPVQEQNIPARDYSAYQTPVPTSAATVLPCTDSSSLAASAFSLDLNAELVHHETTAGEEILLTDRKVSGSFTMEAPDIGAGEWDVWSRARDKQTGPLLYAHGASAGNIVEISAPALEVGKVSYADKNGIAMVQVPFVLLPTGNGDDEIKITFK